MQILLHLAGDYLLQSHWMAVTKTKSTPVAILHSVLYSLPFLLIGSPWAVFLIAAFHFPVDRYRLAVYVCYGKNFLAPKSAWPTGNDLDRYGFPEITPIWLSFWLLIIVDNTLHLVINALILYFIR